MKYAVIETGYEDIIPTRQRFIPDALRPLYPRRYAVIAPVYPDHHITCACGYQYTLTDAQYHAAPHPDTCYRCNTKRAARDAWIANWLKEVLFPAQVVDVPPAPPAHTCARCGRPCAARFTYCYRCKMFLDKKARIAKELSA